MLPLLSRLTALLIVVCLPLQANQNPWYFNHYSIEQGLPQSTASCIVQDKTGFVWIGTHDGINRFDGYQFKSFKHTKSASSLAANWVTDCLVDDRGDLWIATATNGISKYHPDSETFSHINQENSALLDNKIWSLHLTDNNQIWLGTESKGVAKLDPNSLEIVHYGQSQLTMVRDIKHDKDNNLWFGTAAGAYKLNTVSNELTSLAQILESSQLQSSLSAEHFQQLSSPVWSLAFDQQNRIWVGTQKGLTLAELANKNVQVITATDTSNNPIIDTKKLSHNWVISLLKDAQGQMWLGTYGGGIMVFSPAGELINARAKELENVHSLSSNHIMTFFADRQQNMWIGSDGGGVNFFANQRKAFRHQSHAKQASQSISHKFVRAITQDKNQHLWVGTRGGLNRSKLPLKQVSDASQIAFERYTKADNNSDSLIVDNIFALQGDNHGDMWAATYGAGLAKFDHQQQGFVHFQHNAQQADSLSSNHVYSLAIADGDNLWVGTNKGLNLFNTNTGKAERFQAQADNANSLSQNTVFTIKTDSKNRVWIGTRGGLNMLSADRQNFQHFTAESEQPLSSNMVISILPTTNDIVWVGTMQGLNKVNSATGEVKQFLESDGLLNTNIFNIEQDNAGQIWLSTNRGLSRLDPVTETFKHFAPEDGLQDNAYILGASHKTAEGDLLFGGVNGFNWFTPDVINQIAQNNQIALTELSINNQTVAINSPAIQGEKTTLTQALNNTEAIALNHLQNLFSIEFSALNFVNAKNQNYQYKLEGFDKNWLTTNANKRFATYSNLPSGRYQLLVKAENGSGNSADNIKRLTINIAPPPWRTWWAYSLYLLFVSVIISIVLNLLWRKRQADNAQQLAQQVASAKDVLLSNVSHEFKTPLTLILGPLDRLIANSQNKDEQHSLTLIKRNSKRLLTMVEQILDLRQFQQTADSAVALNKELQNLTSTIEFIVDSFQPIAQQQNISLVFQSKAEQSSEPILVLMAPDALEKLLGNLVANALKYSPSNTQITVATHVIKQQVMVDIIDNGYGINEQDINNIFERYQRGAEVDTSISGYGIGLALVKEIVEQHQGSISAKNLAGSETGKTTGSCFTITLPLANTSQLQALNNSLNYKQSSAFNHVVDFQPSAETLDLLSTPNVDGQNNVLAATSAESPSGLLPKVLIIDDNAEIAQYLKQLLSHQYDCISAYNGEQGLEQATAHAPSVIICDVMMPKMDGFSFVEKLRNNLALSHIPVLFLTAKNDRTSRLKGLNLLADDYLTKPFDEEELQIRVQRILSLRTIVKRSVAEQLTQPLNAICAATNIAQTTPQPVVELAANADTGEGVAEDIALEPSITADNLSVKDQQFIQELSKLVAEHYQDHEFGIDKLAQKLCMASRTLQLKLKALADMTPTDFLREYRLNQAAKLLQTTSLNIGQISEQTGFNSQSYFARCFKAKFACGAKEYRQQFSQRAVS